MMTLSFLCRGPSLTKYHRLSGLNNRNLFPHGSEGWKSETEESTGLVSPEDSLLGV